MKLPNAINSARGNRDRARLFAPILKGAENAIPAGARGKRGGSGGLDWRDRSGGRVVDP